jgi:RHS repeat-associated protein
MQIFSDICEMIDTNDRFLGIRSATDYYPFGMEMPGRSFSSSNYRFGFNGKPKDNEVNGNGNLYDYGFRIFNPSISRFLSLDPLTKKFPELTPFQFASNSPIMAIDLDGLEAFAVYNKATNSLGIIPDVSKTRPKLSYKGVSAFDYAKLTPADKSKYNYVILVKNVITGGHSEGGEVKYNTNSKEKPISTGTYNILENKGNTNPAHNSFFVLDPQDNNQYDKVDNRPGEVNESGDQRSGYNLHPGTVSWGCVTINKNDPNLSVDQRAQEWDIISNAINNTKTEQVPDNRGKQKYVPGSTQTKFGTLKIIDKKPVVKAATN